MALLCVVDRNFDPEKEIGPETALCESCGETFTWHPEHDKPEVDDVTVKLVAKQGFHLGAIQVGKICESCQAEAIEVIRDSLFEFMHRNGG
jgi:hypothetical protein